MDDKFENKFDGIELVKRLSKQELLNRLEGKGGALELESKGAKIVDLSELASEVKTKFLVDDPELGRGILLGHSTVEYPLIAEIFGLSEYDKARDKYDVYPDDKDSEFEDPVVFAELFMEKLLGQDLPIVFLLPKKFYDLNDDGEIGFTEAEFDELVKRYNGKPPLYIVVGTNDNIIHKNGFVPTDRLEKALRDSAGV